MTRASQSGFTLIEVVVAFVVFAVSATAIHEVLFGALRRSAKSADESGALLVAQSLRDERSVLPAPWPAESEGEIAGGWQWRMVATPRPVEGSEGVNVQAHDLRIEVRRTAGGRPVAILHSVELLKDQP